jgi:hypothetical protein
MKSNQYENNCFPYFLWMLFYAISLCVSFFCHAMATRKENHKKKFNQNRSVVLSPSDSDESIEQTKHIHRHL